MPSIEYVASGKGNAGSITFSGNTDIPAAEQDLYVVVAFGNAAPESASNPTPSSWTNIYFADRGGGNGSFNGAFYRLLTGSTIPSCSFPQTIGYAYSVYRNVQSSTWDSADTFVGAMNHGSWTAGTTGRATPQDYWVLVDSDISATYAPQTPSGYTARQQHDNAAGSAGVLDKPSTGTPTEDPGQSSSASDRGATCLGLLTATPVISGKVTFGSRVN